MESEIGLQGGAQYSYRPSFFSCRADDDLGKNWPVRSDTALHCGPVRVCVCVCVWIRRSFSPSAAVISSRRRCKLRCFDTFFQCCCCCCRQLSSAVGGYIVTETRMALALFAALWLPCCCHMSCSNTLPTTTPAPVSALLPPSKNPPPSCIYTVKLSEVLC